MVLVITNSRKHSISKLMSQRIDPSSPAIHFVTKTDELPAPTNSPVPAVIIWQRGRVTPDGRQLRETAEYLFSTGALRPPLDKEYLP